MLHAFTLENKVQRDLTPTNTNVFLMHNPYYLQIGVTYQPYNICGDFKPKFGD